MHEEDSETSEVSIIDKGAVACEDLLGLAISQQLFQSLVNRGGEFTVRRTGGHSQRHIQRRFPERKHPKFEFPPGKPARDRQWKQRGRRFTIDNGLKDRFLPSVQSAFEPSLQEVVLDRPTGVDRHAFPARSSGPRIPALDFATMAYVLV